MSLASALAGSLAHGSFVSLAPPLAVPGRTVAHKPVFRAVGPVAGGGNTSHPAFGSPTLAGDLLIGLAVSGDATTTISDATWHEAASVATNGSCSIWYKPNCAANETSPTFHSGGADLATVLIQVKNAAGVLDKTGSATAFMAGSMTATSSAANRTPHNFLVSVAFFANSQTLSITSRTFNNGPITLIDFGPSSGDNNVLHDFNYSQETSDASADSWTVTYTNSVDQSCLLIASFQ